MLKLSIFSLSTLPRAPLKLFRLQEKNEQTAMQVRLFLMNLVDAQMVDGHGQMSKINDPVPYKSICSPVGSAANIFWQEILRFMKNILPNVLALWD